MHQWQRNNLQKTVYPPLLLNMLPILGIHGMLCYEEEAVVGQSSAYTSMIDSGKTLLLALIGGS